MTLAAIHDTLYRKSHRACRGNAPPSCLRKTALPLKSPTGAFIATQTRIFQNCLFTGGVITESGSCRAGFLWKHSRGGINVLPASTSLSSTTPAHENGVQKHPQAFLDPKIKNIISLAYAQSNAERIQNRPTQQESAFCFTPSLAQSPQGLLPPRRR